MAIYAKGREVRLEMLKKTHTAAVSVHSYKTAYEMFENLPHKFLFANLMLDQIHHTYLGLKSFDCALPTAKIATTLKIKPLSFCWDCIWADFLYHDGCKNTELAISENKGLEKNNIGQFQF